jgi:hypothetical protein
MYISLACEKKTDILLVSWVSEHDPIELAFACCWGSSTTSPWYHKYDKRLIPYSNMCSLVFHDKHTNAEYTLNCAQS